MRYYIQVLGGKVEGRLVFRNLDMAILKARHIARQPQKFVKVFKVDADGNTKRIL
jgi:hypothetical protein